MLARLGLVMTVIELIFVVSFVYCIIDAMLKLQREA